MAMPTHAIHADDDFSAHRAIAPPMHVAVTYRYARDPAHLIPMENQDPNAPHDSHIYARYSAPNTTRLEHVLQDIFHPTAGILTYSTGLAAFHAILVLLQPARIFIGEGYHGVHAVISLVSRLCDGRKCQKLPLEQLHLLQPGDIIHVETPVNPTGEARDLVGYAARARAAGAYLTVDSTLAPPPLQDPIALAGADVVMHSATKYLGGHSDMLGGVLVVNPGRVAEGWVERLKAERMVLGAVMGSLEGWLGLRSVRTLELRVRRQAETARVLVGWLVAEIAAAAASVVGKVLRGVRHASLQVEDLDLGGDGGGWLRRQMPAGFGPVFAITARTPELARRLPSRMRVFQHATSLGDVESLIEWRAMSDSSCDECLLRVSCGLEDVEDLKRDFLQACRAVLSGDDADGRVRV
ncbi:cystathionine beta-lyase [Aspergillus aculeatinus CBS 121060]|uniref:Cystathionine gamma-synthase n=1 Tax=Aspergillus aculeatinus CBS 121060 TaxID=1448322 RepID=A0ACD1H2Y8_9EURO|nr:cystathionine gamma-synthase [Aspergillus aculeatinus CBS 121060]RAH67790.1 cystathionine gamma-synthase [Aspergillus aculeatinus CBS 121060]